MALFGEARDISMFRYINRELMHNIISQQCVLYKVNVTETKTNLYGEASSGRVFREPILLYALIDRFDQTSRQAMLERRAAEADFSQNELNKTPMTIFIG